IGDLTGRDVALAKLIDDVLLSMIAVAFAEAGDDFIRSFDFRRRNVSAIRNPGLLPSLERSAAQFVAVVVDLSSNATTVVVGEEVGVGGRYVVGVKVSDREVVDRRLFGAGLDRGDLDPGARAGAQELAGLQVDRVHPQARKVRVSGGRAVGVVVVRVAGGGLRAVLVSCRG